MGREFGVRIKDPKQIAGTFLQFAKQVQAAPFAWFEIIGTGLPYPVLARFSTTSDGRRICTALVFGSPDSSLEIRSRQLRDVPLSQVDAAANRASSPIHQFLGLAPKLSKPYRPRHPGPAGHDQSHFKKVVAEYREAKRSSETPIKRVANRLGVSVATVHRWLDEAEDCGLSVPKRNRRKKS